MTMRLKGQTRNEYMQAREAFMNAVKTNAPQDQQTELYGDLLDKMQEHMIEEAKTASYLEDGFTSQPNTLKGNEMVFFNEFDKNIPKGVEKLLPEETIDRIFEDIKSEHPLLEKIGLKNLGIRLNFLTSERSGGAVWGKVFGEIKGQLKASFGSRQEIQHKLTAFIVIPKDFKELGPVWIENFVRTQLTESFAVALEEGFLNGDGDNKPLGLTRQLTGVAQGSNITYPKKEKQALKLTFENPKETVNQVSEIFKFHSVKADGVSFVDTTNKIVLVVNSEEIWEIEKKLINFTDSAAYNKAIPLNLQIIPSISQEKGKATSFIQGRYDAVVGGGINLQRYQDTLALEDMDLYVAKQFAYGKAHDEKTAAVWELDFSKNQEPGIGG